MATYGNLAKAYFDAFRAFKQETAEAFDHAYVKELGRIAAHAFMIDISSLGWKVDESYANLASGLEASPLFDETLPEKEMLYIQDLLDRSAKNNGSHSGKWYQGTKGVHKARAEMLKAAKKRA